MCQDAKPREAFYKNRTKPRGIDGNCKECKGNSRGRQAGRFKACKGCRQTFFAMYKKVVFCSSNCAKRSLDSSMEKNPNWRGGLTKSKKGYWYVKTPGHPRASKTGYVKRADLVLEKKIGRPLQKGEIAHHKNEIKDDDHPDNLELMTSNDHVRHHHPAKPKIVWDPAKPEIGKPPPKRVDWPSLQQLKELVKKTSLRQVAQQIGCSHVAIFYRLGGKHTGRE
jgi:HNH endonuclease